MSKGQKVVFTVVVLVLIFASGVWAANHLLVGSPVAEALEADHRNAELDLSAHLQYFVAPNVLVLNLKGVGEASPADLGRALFQSAEALHDAGREFERVVLSRGGTPVFQLTGTDFAEIGSEFSRGQNPVYLIRKLPSKLHHPDGTQAYGEWTGGLLGVVGREMQDYTEAMTTWAMGTL